MMHLPLSQGKVALVDDADYDWLHEYKWHWAGHYVARRARGGETGTTIYLHRFILQAPAHLQVDHINNDRLDNQRANLRLCTGMQNSRNYPSRGVRRFRGVSFHKPTAQYARLRPYQAHIVLNGRTCSLGYYATDIEAAAAYDRKAREVFGEFAWQNLKAE